MHPKAGIFDLDNTLAEPFHPPTQSTLQKFSSLLEKIPLAIMSAASLERVQRDVLSHAPSLALDRLTLFTANAAQCYVYKAGAWSPEYTYGFSAGELARIKTALEQSVGEAGIDTSHSYGRQFVDYEGYVAFTALGMDAPKEERKAWDPDRSKRIRVRNILMRKIPEFDVYIGGATSVDVTPKNINKEFGVKWYAKYLSLSPSEILYVGDALYEGGNDAAVIATGVQTRAVAGPAETERVIDELLSTL